jgi:transcriptional regulator with XRE-family HTH domain
MRNDNPTEVFAAMISGLRGAGLKRSEIAQRSGISRQQLWRLENTVSRRPSLESFQKLERLHSQVVTKAARPKVAV